VPARAQRRSGRSGLLLAAASVAAVLIPVWSASVPAAGPRAPLAGAGVAGAAYVPDRECAGCHRALAESFAGVGMGRSFHRPTPERRIEALGDEHAFVHEASGRRYSMHADGDGLRFRRARLLPDGGETDVIELPVAWILGSGNKARTYLIANPASELYQLPIAWYTAQQSWGMAPGFDRAHHHGVQRRVTRECLFCHNAYPEPPGGGGDAWDAPDSFPQRLPEGIGCQRCHGPGSEHAARAREGAAAADLRASIVNPARLDPARRDDVCDACHLQPTAAVFGVRRVGRTDYSWRAGERLDEFVAKVDVEEEGIAREERFEINHHPYRLRQSRCFEEAGRALSCLTCHDPHRKVSADRRETHYRAACLGCHRSERATPAAGSWYHDRPDGDCVSCHMPQRRTSDVVQAVMTDHRIALPPADPAALLASRAERDPSIADVFLVGAAAAREQDRLYRLLAVLQAAPHREAAERLERLLVETGESHPEPWTALGVAQLQLGWLEQAEVSFERVLRADPDQWQALRQLAVTRSRRGDRRGAIALLERALERQPDVPELHYNRGVLLMGEDRVEEARSALERAVELRPTLAAGWAYLGIAARRSGDEGGAERAFERALAVDPGNGIVLRERAAR
jgi:Tfp pilus assembly protein PilF